MTRQYLLMEVAEIAAELLAAYPAARVWALHGDLGAGKTTLVQALARQLGVQAQLTSPTFALVNTYNGHLHTVHHFDFYRINNSEEALAMGFEEYLTPDAYCFIEWPERIETLLPADTLHLQLEPPANDVDSDNSFQRVLTVIA